LIENESVLLSVFAILTYSDGKLTTQLKLKILNYFLTKCRAESEAVNAAVEDSEDNLTPTNIKPPTNAISEMKQSYNSNVSSFGPPTELNKLAPFNSTAHINDKLPPPPLLPNKVPPKDGLNNKNNSTKSTRNVRATRTRKVRQNLNARNSTRKAKLNRNGANSSTLKPLLDPKPV
jgi:hypothetical protein